MLFNLPDPKMILLVILVFVPLERLFPLHDHQKTLRKWWKTDALYLLLNGTLTGIGINCILFAIILVSSILLPDSFTGWVASQPFWLQIPVMLVLADLCFYAVHRIFHEVPCLWKFHSVHHSSERLDWLAAYRVHPIDQICTKGASLVPVFLLGFSATNIVIFFFIYQWQSLLIHSNTRFRFGVLEHIFASPRFHHWHHANELAAYHKNYASQLPLIDAVFGTLYMPDKMPSSYGTNETVPEKYIAQLAFPFNELISSSKNSSEIQ